MIIPLSHTLARTFTESSEKVGTILKRTLVLISGFVAHAARTDAK